MAYTIQKRGKVSQTVERFFPTPQYLRMSAVGVDVSDTSLKYLELSSTPEGLRLGSYGKRELRDGIVKEGEVLDEAAFLQVLQKIHTQHGFSFVRLSLPEEHSYLFRAEVPKDVSADDMRTTIEFKLKENVPLSPSEALFDYAPLMTKEKGSMQLVDVSVYPRDSVEKMVSLFARSGMQALSVEVEGQAIARSLIPKGDRCSYMIVDLGKTEAGLYVVEDGRLAFSATLDIGGVQFTQAIANTLEVSIEEAETLKQEKGLLQGEENKEVREALSQPIAQLAHELERHQLYWHEHSATGGKDHAKIASVILTGGNANIKGLPEYLHAQLNAPIKRGEVWQNVADLDTYIPDLLEEEAAEYATAIGLALRTFM